MCFFCFKQKTAYEMRISDWSSDVCSSDLIGDAAIAIPFDAGEPDTIASMVAQTAEHFGRIDVLHNNAALLDLAFLERDRTAVDTDIEVWERTMRSAESRVGKACVSTCRSRWCRINKKKPAYR